MDFRSIMSLKQWLLVSAILASIVIANPIILYKLFNLLSALIAAVVGIILALFIAMKVLDQAIARHGNSDLERNNRVLQQNGAVVSANSAANLSLFSKLHLKIVQSYDSFLEGLAKSMKFYHSPVLVPAPVNNSIQNLQEKIRFLGRSPEQGFQVGTYVCVSQNVDMLMNRIFEYTFRDYVETWYSTVSSDQGKLHKLVKADFWAAYKVFSSRLTDKVDIINLVMNRYTKTLLQYYKELDETDPEKKACPSAFHLHPCLKDDNSEREFMRRISDYIIRLCFPPHISSNSSSRLILREILAGLVFLPLIDTVSDPDYINQSILSYLQSRETAEEEKSRTYAYAATYEDFIRIISHAESVTELQQIHRHIMTELLHATAISSLKRDEKRLGKARSMAKGELLLSRDLKRYINQCQVARQQCEKRIRHLGGDSYQNERTFGDKGDVAIASSVHLLTFSEVMGSPMARSYFLKYMKKIGKGSLMKFWSEVDIVRESSPTGKELAKIISHIYQTYIVGGSPDELPFEIDKTILKGMQTCVLGNKSQDDFYKLQEEVSRILEKEHFPSFVVSDFYICQLMPQLNEDESGEDHGFQQEFNDPNQERTAAFGSRKSASDTAIATLKEIEEKLEYKAQALESLKPQAKHDQKLTRQLEVEIENLQKDKLNQQLHIERTETWWSRMGSWSATIDSVSLLSENEDHSKVPVYSIIVVCSGVPIYEVTDDVSGWVVTRNLEDFKELHQSLKEFSPWLKKRRLPSIPVLTFGGLSDKFLEKSKIMLNDYLKDILKDDILSRSELVYAFLSPLPNQGGKDTSKRKGLPRRATFSRGLGSSFQGPAAGRKRSMWEIGGLLLTLPKDILESVLRSDDELSDSDEGENDDTLVELDSIATPLYELISEIFEIQGLFRPMRKTLIIFVRVAFGGTINKQVRDTLQWLVSEPMLTYYLHIFIDSMWPDGHLKPKLKERTEEDKIQTALEARVKLLQNIPESFQNLIGQQNARQGLLKIFQSLQEKQLNKHLLYNLISETVEEVFPEILRTE